MSDELDKVTPLSDERRKRRSRGWGGRRPGAVELTEHGLACAFTERHGRLASFDHELGCWAYWCEDAGCWRFDRVGLVTHWARNVCAESTEGEKESLQAKLRKRSTVGAVESFARCDPTHARMDAHRDLAQRRGSARAQFLRPNRGRRKYAPDRAFRLHPLSKRAGIPGADGA